MPKNMRKYLTVEDLFAFCEQSNLTKFSAEKAGGPIIVQSFGEVSVSDTSKVGLTPCTLMACHTELNRNRSFIADEVAEKALSSFSNRPILGYQHQLSDGTWAFWDHHMGLEEDENGDSQVTYLESPIGIVPESCNAHLEYDENNKKNYVVVNGYIYDDYGNHALDIIKNNNGKISVSVEIAVNELSFNVKEGYMSIDDMTFMGVTCLGKTPEGKDVLPGMEGANLKLDNFSQKQNSIFSNLDTTKLIETLDKLNLTLKSFQINKKMEGVKYAMNHFEELLEQYGFTEDELDFDYSTMTDEELDVAFEEFKCKKKCEEDEPEDEPGTGDEETDPPASDPDDDDDEHTNDDDDDHIVTKKKKYSVDEEGNTHIEYELSHDDIRCAIYSLLYAEDNYDVWVVEVFDAYFIGQNYMDGKFFKQHYTKTEDSVAFEGESIEVFAEYLTQAEKDVLAALKADYAELKAFKDNYEAAETKAKKDEIFASEAYNEIRDSEDFKGLMADAEKFSVDDIQTKCDLMFAAKMKKTFTKEPEKQHKIQFNLNATQDKKKKTYGNLFDK